MTAGGVTMDETPGVVASPERIDAWMEVAQPGDLFIYATRRCLPNPCKSAAYMRTLADRGLVVLAQARSKADPDYFHYTARRTSAPTAMTKPMRPRLAAVAVVPADGEAVIVDALFPVLRRFAQHGRPCPTDKQLAKRTGLSVEAVECGLHALSAAHMIRVQKVSAPTLRRVVIVATGHITGIAA